MPCDVKDGQTPGSAFNVRSDTILILQDSADKLILTAGNSISRQGSVKIATKVIPLSMVSVYRANQTTLQTLDAENGTTRSVLNARKDGILTKMGSVSKLTTVVGLGILRELVFRVTTDIS